MKRIIGIIALSLSFLGIAANPAAQAQGIVTQGDWSLAYPDFSKYLTDEEWDFELKANGSNVIGSSDYVNIEVFTSTNKQVAFDTYIHTGGNTKSVKLSLMIYKSELNRANLSAGLVAKVSVDRSFSSNLADTTVNFNIPTTTFPKRPAQLTDYIKISTDFSKAIEFPKECTDVFFSYTMNDPYSDIDEVNFDIIDSAGKSVASAYSYGYRSETIQGEMSLCPYSLEVAKAPFKFQVEIQFEAYLNKAPLVSQTAFNVQGKYSAVDSLISGMPNVCQKGSNFKTAKGNCPAGYKSVSFQNPSTIEWNTLTRSAGSLKGKKFLVYGCVAQFDTNTGGGKFRAYTLPAPADRYYNGANSLYTGSSKSLLKLSEDDAFAAKVTVSGATTYTTLGGKTSVPTFAIRDFVKIGKC